jgi:hypothetical protein
MRHKKLFYRAQVGATTAFPTMAQKVIFHEPALKLR